MMGGITREAIKRRANGDTLGHSEALRGTRMPSRAITCHPVQSRTGELIKQPLGVARVCPSGPLAHVIEPAEQHPLRGIGEHDALLVAPAAKVLDHIGSVPVRHGDALLEARAEARVGAREHVVHLALVAGEHHDRASLVRVLCHAIGELVHRLLGVE